MKKFFLFIASTASVLSFAGNANSYTCQGEKGTEIIFSSSSLIGQPQMSVVYQGQAVKASQPLKVLQAPVGALATITDNHLVPVDGPSVNYTLIVPIVKLDANNHKEEFKSTLIRTSVVNALFGPRNAHGPAQYNVVEEVNCEAEQVVF